MNRTRWIVVAVVAVVVAGGLWLWKGRGSADAPRYRTVELARGSVEAVVAATGTIRPVEQVEVGSQVSGTVSAVRVDYNARVRAGDVLLQIEPSAFRARVVQAEAAVAKAEAGRRDAERALRRARELAASQAIAEVDVEAAEVALEQRRADLQQARAQLEVARVDLANTTIRSPIDGVVISRAIEVGQTVAASLQAPRMFVIARDLAQMQVETRIDEADIGRIQPGLPVSYTVDAFPDFTFEGEVAQVRLEPITEQNVVTYTTVIRTANPGGRLRPGMTANVAVKVARRDDVLRVPNAALRFRPAGAPATRAVAAAGARGSAPTAAGVGGAGARGSEGPGAGGAARAASERPGARAGGGGDREAAIARMRERGMSEEQIRAAIARRSGADGARPADGAGESAAAAGEATAAAGKPGAVHVLRGGRPVRVEVTTGLDDGAFSALVDGALAEGDRIVVGLEIAAGGASLQPPPGMGGPGFGGRGRGGRR